MTEPRQFRTVLRGFDPAQVMTTIEELTGALSTARHTVAERTDELATAQERATELARQLEDALAELDALRGGVPAPSHPDDLAPRVTAILALAEEEASQRREETEREADEILRTAEAQAARMTAAAAASADAIVEQASREGRRILSSFDERARASEEVRLRLIAVHDLLVRVDNELATEVHERAGPDPGAEIRGARPVPN
jgi:cell division septum initiation protein DivIVA